MKKLTTILLATLLIFSVLIVPIGCTITPAAPTPKSAVQLLGVIGNTSHPQLDETSTLYASVLRTPIELNGFFPSSSTEKSADTYANFITIDSEENHIYFTINLSNPNDYYIFDFKLTCSNKDVEICQNNEMVKLDNDNFHIRWDEASERHGNQKAMFELQLPECKDKDISLTISEMYYSDRADGSNKTAVDLNGKSKFTIYKFDERPVETVERMNSTENFRFKIKSVENATVKSVQLDGTEITPDSNGIYNIKGGTLEIRYEYHFSKDTVLDIIITEKIELLKITKTSSDAPCRLTIMSKGEAELVIFAIYQGTDYYVWENLSDNFSISGLDLERDFTRMYIRSEKGFTLDDLKELKISVAGHAFEPYTEFDFENNHEYSPFYIS